MNPQQRNERCHLIVDGIQRGLTIREIAQQAGVSGPAISQWIARTPELRRLRPARPSAVTRIKALQAELRAIQVDARREIRRLDDELLSYTIDRAADG